MPNNSKGASAPIVINTSRERKASWVRQSQAQGKKLTDWIIERVEQQMSVFKVPETLADKYRGSGHALAAVVNGQLVDIVYLDDVLPDFEGSEIRDAINDERIAPTVRQLQALGDVHVGMLSCWEFCQL